MCYTCGTAPAKTLPFFFAAPVMKLGLVTFLIPVAFCHENIHTLMSLSIKSVECVTCLEGCR